MSALPAPNPAEQPEVAALPVEPLVLAKGGGFTLAGASIDAAENEDDPLSARMGERDARYDAVEERALLAPALAQLPTREQAILRMRFVEGLTQSEIAVTIGVSQMHVSRLLTSSLEKLRRQMGPEPAQ